MSEKFKVEARGETHVVTQEEGDKGLADLFAPEGGWMPEDFGQITVAPIPYTSNSWVRPDPHWAIQADGWLYIEVGNVRIAIPDEEEWNKIVSMGNRMWNTNRRSIAMDQAKEEQAYALEALEEQDASPENP